MLTNIRYILLTALRDKLFLALVLGVVAAAGISRVLGGTALIEAQEMALAFASASSRVIVMMGLIVFVCFHIRQAFDTREIDVFLSRPITRTNLVFSYWLGFSFVAVLLGLLVGVVLAFMGVKSLPGFAFWLTSLLLEGMLVVAIALFAAFTLKSAVSSVMASMGFYVLARMMGYFMITTESAMLFRIPELNYALTGALKIISIFIPRLDFFSKSEWLNYGVADAAGQALFAWQALVFIPVLLLAAMIDFRRKQF